MDRCEPSLLAFLRATLSGRYAIERIENIRSEASLRHFFRLHRRGPTYVAMVYPQPSAAEIDRIGRFTALYLEQGLCVPRIIDVLGDRIVLQEDAGDLLLQKRFGCLDRKAKAATVWQWAEILVRLRAIDPGKTAARLGSERLKWELDFFSQHLSTLFPDLAAATAEQRPLLHQLADAIGPESVFAHRDFHTRNMLHWKRRICLVDFQDSLVAPPLYDLVSLAFDAYRDLKHWRKILLGEVQKSGLVIEQRQLLLSALQRNIKALGTFAFQVAVRRHRRYALYMPRTLRYVVHNLGELNEARFLPLSRYFNRLGQALGSWILPRK